MFYIPSKQAGVKRRNSPSKVSMNDSGETKFEKRGEGDVAWIHGTPATSSASDGRVSPLISFLAHPVPVLREDRPDLSMSGTLMTTLKSLASGRRGISVT